VTLMRGDLVRILRAEAVRSGARISGGHRLADPGEFAGDADLVVGADGICAESANIWTRTCRRGGLRLTRILAAADRARGDGSR
jgi:hypothetical protein